MRTIVCDRCGERTGEGRTRLEVACGPLRPHRPTVDLCAHCAADLAGFLASPPRRRVASADAPGAGGRE